MELFFKWIKQNLRIKSFYGNSDNAVRDASLDRGECLYVLLAIIKRELKRDDRSLAEIQQILSVTLFEETPVLQVLTTICVTKPGRRVS